MATDTLEEIMGDRGSGAPEQADREQSEGRQPRDESGRFASQERREPEAQDQGQQPAGAEGGEPAGDDGQRGRVPQEALHAARERARASQDEIADLRARNERLEAQMQAFLAGQQAPRQERQQQQAPVLVDPATIDPLADPAGWSAAVRAQIRDEVMREAREATTGTLREQMALTSMARTHREHGDEFLEAHKAATAEARRNPGFDFELQQNAYDLGNFVWGWYQDRKLRSEIGADPAKWRETERARMRAELLAELGAEEVPSTPAGRSNGGRTPASMPTSFAGAGGGAGGNRRGNENLGAVPLRQIMGR